MEQSLAVDLANRCHRILEPLHSLVYFAPEAEAAFTGVGLRPGRMCYFAGRAAPLGAVGPGTVAATFYNFNPAVIAHHIPRAWSLATPEQVVSARFAAVDAALVRLLGEQTAGSPELAEAAELARAATTACTQEGRPLYAGHADLDWPSEPHLVLWHAITLLREYRGDAHIAALVGANLGGLAALITHVATGKSFTEAAAKAIRGWSDEEWDAELKTVQDQGLLDEAGKLTDAGLKLRAELEAATVSASLAPWIHLGADRAARLFELGRALSRQAVAAGAFPAGVFTVPRSPDA